MSKQFESKRTLWVYLFLGLSVALSLLLVGCGGATPRNSDVITVMVNTGASEWMTAAVKVFNSAEIETPAGRQVFVSAVDFVDAGEAVVNITNGSSPDVWIPDDKVWANVAADQGNSAYQNDCASVAESPLVIGMWREVAGLLGWPGRSLGWLDIGSLAADPVAWDYYSGGQFGESLRLGHTHPGLSGSGASTLLALVQSAESKTIAVTASDIEQPIVQASVGAFEGGVSWFASDTEGLAVTMNERGVSYLGAAVMYESTVLARSNPDLVPIYPFEGTFVATHPACINDSADPAQQEAARTFRDWLLADEQAVLADYGLRRVDGNVEMGGLLSAENGVDLSEPANIFAPPSVETIYAVQELWQSARKPLHLVMLLDTSGSMRGDKMESMREAAQQFVRQMGDEDRLSLIIFSTTPTLITDYQLLSESRQSIESVISRLFAQGDTSLYDAIGDGADVITNRNALDRANAMVVLTDGQDTSSFRYFLGPVLYDRAGANDTTVFTIAYGRDADADILEELAIGANGKFFLGDEASIGAIYDEMSAAFGGSVGIGR